jgi:peptidoglycan hydrolase-like protein with peptidoglycan-binding domain
MELARHLTVVVVIACAVAAFVGGPNDTDHRGAAPAGPAGAGLNTVLAAQLRLISLGLDPGAVDGMVGPQTRAALRAYADRSGVAVTSENLEAILVVEQIAP